MRVINIKKTAEKLNVSRSTVYRICKSDPTFPAKVRSSVRCCGYIEEEVDAWVEGQKGCE